MHLERSGQLLPAGLEPSPAVMIRIHHDCESRDRVRLELSDQSGDQVGDHGDGVPEPIVPGRADLDGHSQLELGQQRSEEIDVRFPLDQQHALHDHYRTSRPARVTCSSVLRS
jgi:hypothetical protein